MTKAKEWEVVDSYGVVCFTGGLRECGVWIDPIFGVAFRDGMNGWRASDDADRVTTNDDGTFTVSMYAGPGGMGGDLLIRPTVALRIVPKGERAETIGRYLIEDEIQQLPRCVAVTLKGTQCTRAIRGRGQYVVIDGERVPLCGNHLDTIERRGSEPR